MAEYKDVPIYDIPARQLKAPKPHIDDATYRQNHEASVKNPDEFWGKVSADTVERRLHAHTAVPPPPSWHERQSTGMCRSRLFALVAF